MKAPDEGYVAKIRSAGFFTKGLVYSLVGTLTLMATAGLGGELTSTQGVVEFLLTLPLGKILGAIIFLGLLAYILWRFYEMIFLPRQTSNKTITVKKGFQRFRFLYSGIFYSFIAYSFLSPLLESFQEQESNLMNSMAGTEEEAALWELLSSPEGKLMIWIIALVIGAQALWQFKIAYSASFMKKIDNNPDIHREYDFIRKTGRAGYFARGLVFGIISFFLIKVILHHNANMYKNTEGVLVFLFDLSYGSVLSGAVAIGLISYGIFNMMVARHADLTAIE